MPRALVLIQEKKEADANRIIQDFEEEGIQVLNGRYGPYITDKEEKRQGTERHGAEVADTGSVPGIARCGSGARSPRQEEVQRGSVEDESENRKEGDQEKGRQKETRQKGRSEEKNRCKEIACQEGQRQEEKIRG